MDEKNGSSEFFFFSTCVARGKKNDNELRGKETECVNGEEGNVERER